MSFKWVVNHATDDNKKDGIMDSYGPGMILDAQGKQVPGVVAFVHWPALPQPCLHVEAMDDLIKDNIYIPEQDDDDEELNSEIVATLATNHPDIYEEIVEALSTEDEDEDEDTGALTPEVLTSADDAETVRS